jgi:hypothetical protein
METNQLFKKNGIYRDTLALVLAISSQVELLLKTAIKRSVRGKGGGLVFCLGH